MKAVFQLFWRICLLRQSPALVPTQSWFVITVIAANLLTSVIVSAAVDPGGDAMEIITRVVVGQTAYASLLWLATFLRQHPNRFPATLTALFGCDLLITAVFGVLAPLLGSLLGTGALNIASTGFLLWSLAVAGFILAEALSVQLLIGILLALGMTVLSVSAGFVAIGA
jgi:hypothetical protein